MAWRSLARYFFWRFSVSSTTFLRCAPPGTLISTFARAFRAVAQDKIKNIAARDDAHQGFVLHHGQRADPMAAQQADRRRQRSFRAHDEDIMRHDLFDGNLGGEPIN